MSDYVNKFSECKYYKNIDIDIKNEYDKERSIKKEGCKYLKYVIGYGGICKRYKKRKGCKYQLVEVK
jgi:hypothetical protein